MVDPALFLWAPAKENDNPMVRKVQHLYWALPYSFLFALWRIDSLKVCAATPGTFDSIFSPPPCVPDTSNPTKPTRLHCTRLCQLSKTRLPSVFFFHCRGFSSVGRAFFRRLPPHRQVAFQRKLWGECARLGAHYALLFALFPARVLLPAVFLSGLLTATIVTVSHVTEDLYFDGPHKVGVWGVGVICS